MNIITKLLCSVACFAATSASAKDLEVTHWWTSGGEAAAVSTLAKAFNEKTDHNWVDGAIAGGGYNGIDDVKVSKKKKKSYKMMNKIDAAAMNAKFATMFR